MVGKPKQTKVKLKATLENGIVKFTPSSPLWYNQDEKYVFSKKALGMDADDYHVVEFSLTDDETGYGLRYPPMATDAMWVMRHNPAAPKCPDMNDVSDYAVMGPMVRADDHTLLAYNLNPSVEEWCFTLNFVKQGESSSNKAAYVPYDPIGSNKDFTGFSQSALTAGAAAVGAAFVGALAYFSGKKIREQRRK